MLGNGRATTRQRQGKPRAAAVGCPCHCASRRPQSRHCVASAGPAHPPRHANHGMPLRRGRPAMHASDPRQPTTWLSAEAHPANRAKPRPLPACPHGSSRPRIVCHGGSGSGRRFPGLQMRCDATGQQNRHGHIRPHPLSRPFPPPSQHEPRLSRPVPPAFLLHASRLMPVCRPDKLCIATLWFQCV
ncbi:hypothetical protein COCSADRAFT_257093 [Bipolaris sorokiniana ND90Pr]|uniref:Uncharacterized protein n=1 Tax=Cochliobolus sativus (strain ND90Pr / ATCC 201652) TaxID=665912 RepID=M2SQA0_COCSN|nr:uncharacterized protein COCSADRAFT_257093 [Bipolaris sorokiniana ND90Pr]EMD59301.1 hypothetical protein COCSADRAFT_257093 [Bipolaris sorokiniana ND90Pr]